MYLWVGLLSMLLPQQQQQQQQQQEQQDELLFLLGIEASGFEASPMGLESFLEFSCGCEDKAKEERGWSKRP
ncbi:hypothetical protein Emag_005303 [Eimeria magna]